MTKPRAIKAKPANIVTTGDTSQDDTPPPSHHMNLPDCTKPDTPTAQRRTRTCHGSKSDQGGVWGYEGGRMLGWGDYRPTGPLGPLGPPAVEYGGGRGYSPRGYYMKPGYGEDVWCPEGVWDPTYSPRDDCHSAPPILPDPHGGPPQECHPPPFRRTPGAARPTSTSSGSRPGSACSRISFQFDPSPCSSLSDEQDFYGLYDNTFLPIRSCTPSPLPYSPYPDSGPSSPTKHTELMVSNLDYNISAREWKKILYAEFQQQVQVSDNTV